MNKPIALQKLLLRNPYAQMRLLRRKGRSRSDLLLSTLNIIPIYLAEIDYYGVYEPNIGDATISFIIFKPLEYLIENAIGSLKAK